MGILNIHNKSRCGRCKVSYDTVPKWKPLEDEWITQEMDMALLHFKGVCQECMDSMFPPITTEGATQTDLAGEQC